MKKKVDWKKRGKLLCKIGKWKIYKPTKEQDAELERAKLENQVKALCDSMREGRKLMDEKDAKLAKAIEALERIADSDSLTHGFTYSKRVAEKCLAKLRVN